MPWGTSQPSPSVKGVNLVPPGDRPPAVKPQWVAPAEAVEASLTLDPMVAASAVWPAAMSRAGNASTRRGEACSCESGLKKDDVGSLGLANGLDVVEGLAFKANGSEFCVGDGEERFTVESAFEMFQCQGTRYEHTGVVKASGSGSIVLTLGELMIS
ncbi:hypothetical protein HG531_011852 [Fusarium graminearum]|nr:hypothetical protein HG531_011852 [Fusarium graminearum]